MHELGITRNIVAIVSEHACGRRVRRVVLDVGKLAGVMPDAITFCFDVVAQGTSLEKAKLEICSVEARALCKGCKSVFVQETLLQNCRCGARDFERISGEELMIREYELEQD